MPHALSSDVIFFSTHDQPPRLEDEEKVQWSSGMKDFIKEAYVSEPRPPLLRVASCMGCLLKLRFSLIHDPETRPTPKELLEHRWIVRNMKTEVPMAKWIAQVWGWSFPEGRKSLSKEEWVLLYTLLLAEASRSRMRTQEGGKKLTDGLFGRTSRPGSSRRDPSTTTPPEFESASTST